MAVDGEERIIVGIEQEFDGTGIGWLAVHLEDYVTGCIGER